MIVDFRASFQNAVNGAFIAKEIRRQYFDDGPGSGADGQNTLIKMIRAAVRQIVARDGGDNNMAQAEAGGGLGDTLRLIGFQFFRLAARHRAKPARPSTDIPENHERGRAPRITFRSIGAASIFADGLQP